MTTTFEKPALRRRDEFGWDNNDDGDDVPWWHSDTGVIVKWTIFITITVLFLTWVIGGYLHAKSRIKKGLPPLRYHRCFISRRVLAQVDPSYAYAHPTYVIPQQQNGYAMYSMPPPVYDPTRPPMYQAPEGSSKIDPSQGRMDPTRQPWGTQAAPEYEAPPGPPPGMR
ncbi:hypothetical protein G7046_g3232 [Stylonectria norvegica]|nr:hypothetical protein G7046_g3232 [Stylonectria norvegica]